MPFDEICAAHFGEIASELASQGAPIGELVPGMAYLVRRLLENTANESFLRQTYVESRDLEASIAAPDS